MIRRQFGRVVSGSSDTPAQETSVQGIGAGSVLLPKVKTLNAMAFKRTVLSGALFACSLAPGVAGAIGFGKPAINSAIGQPLSIRVPLIAVQPGELETLEVGLAERSWYQISGVEYPELGQRLNLLLDQSDPLNPAIVVSTRDGVDQVAIPLVLELQWPQRVMRRQINVLLNPVGYEAIRSPSLPQTAAADPLNESDDSVVPVEASGTTTSPRSVSNAYDSSLSGADVSGLQPRSGNTSASAFSDIPSAQPIASDNSGAPTASADAESAPAAPRPESITVASGDTLSTIVDRYLPDGATRFQGRITFYDQNESAFRGGDIHNIVQGAQLDVPSEAEILALPAADARRRYAALSRPAVDEAASTPDTASDVAGDAAGATSLSEDIPATGGFRLSLLEVEESEIIPDPANMVGADSGTDSSQDARIAQSGSLGADPDQAALNAAGAAGIGAGDFAMQGFSMKLTVMNAYIVELQDENRQLKQRVDSLEQKVEQLILRAQQPSATASLTNTGGVGEVAPGQAFVSEPAVSDAAISDVAEAPGLAAIDSEADLANVVDTDVAAPDVAIEEPATNETVADSSLVEPGLAESPAVPAVDPAADRSLADDSAAPAEARVIPGSADGDRAGSSEGIEVATTTPSLAYRDDLLGRAKATLQQFNTPLTQLIAAIVALGTALLLWMVMKDRRKYRLAEEFREETDDELDYDEADGVDVAYADGSEVTVLDLDDDPWMSQSEIGEDQLEGLGDSDVDLITQSEVYLTYDRPVQAIEVLQEEYGKSDSDKFVVASRILRILEDMGQNPERNGLLRNFIVVLNGDIEEFSASEWEALRHDLNGLRRAEHLSAVESGDNAADGQTAGEDHGEQFETMSDLREDQEHRASGFGSVASANDADIDPDFDQDIGKQDDTPLLDDQVTGEGDKESGDATKSDRLDPNDGVIELNYEKRGKAQSR